MPKPESLSGRSESNKEHVRRSVRVFAVAPIEASQLEGQLQAGHSIENLPLVRVILGRKNYSNLVTAIGEKLEPGEDLLGGAQRAVFNKTLLTRESRRKIGFSIGSGQPVSYTRNDNKIHCEAFLTVMPVRGSTVSLHQPSEREGKKSIYKISELIHVTPSQLAELFSRGKIVTDRTETVHMFGHLTQVPVTDVTLTPGQRKIQNKEFDRVLDEVRAYEFELKNETITQINRMRRLHHKPHVSHLGECAHDEIVRGFILAKWNLGMADNIMRDHEGGQYPTETKDLTTSALYLREFPAAELTDALMASPTRPMRRTRNAIFYALNRTMEDLSKLMELDIKKFAIGWTDNPKPMDTATALRTLWPQMVKTQSPENLTSLLDLLDDSFTHHLADHLKQSYTVVRGALALVPELPSYLAGELRSVKRDMFQELYPPNEVASAMERPFFQMLWVLGLNPYKGMSEEPESEATKRYRGEILMQIAIQLSAIPSAEQQMAAKNSLFERVLADFMKQPPQLDELRLKRTPHIVYRRVTEKPVDGKPIALWYDKRQAKSLMRVWIKGIQEPVIKDVFSHNFVIKDENVPLADRFNIPLRLDMAATLRDALIDHYQEELRGDGWRVFIVPGTHKTGVIDTARKIVSIQSESETNNLIAKTEYRKRSGSIANTIIREKFVLAFEKNGKMLMTEICIYPFEQTNVEGSPLSHTVLIGFVESLLDHMSRNYNGYRLIMPDENDKTAPSVIEEIRPPAWYGAAYDPIWGKQRKPRPRRNKRT